MPKSREGMCDPEGESNRHMEKGGKRDALARSLRCRVHGTV